MNPPLSTEQKQLIDNKWQASWDGVIQAQNQALNWIFTMNTGGVAGALAYAASRPAGAAIIVGLVFFSVGLLSVIGYAACMFYSEARYHKAYKTDLEAFYASAIDWAELRRRDSKRPAKYFICEVLAWVSAVGGGLGIVSCSIAIL